MKWLNYSQVAQAPQPRPAPKEVAERRAYIPVTLKASTKVLEVDPAYSQKVQDYKALTIAPYYREAIVGHMMKPPSKSFKASRFIFLEGNEAVAISGTQITTIRLAVATKPPVFSDWHDESRDEHTQNYEVDYRSLYAT